MNKNGIDDLLKIVSPELVTGYTARNFTAGSSLHAVNEEYKAAVQSPKMDFFDWLKLVGFSSVVGMLLLLFLLYKNVPAYIADLSMLGIIAPAYLYFLFPATRKFRKDRETLDWCAPILLEFRQAVEAINPDDERNVQITEGGVRFVLANLANRKYDAEVRYKEACQRGVSVQEIIPVASSLIESEEQFVAALVGARMLGLAVNTADLFRSAKAKRTWEDEGCPM